MLEGVDELAGDPSETEMITETLGVSLDDLFTIRFVVTAPGSLGDNNASSTDGSKATWDVKPDADFVTDGDATMTAEWTPGGGSSGSSVWIILAIIAVVAAIAAVAVVLVKRSKGQSPGPTDAPDPASSSPGTPPPPGMTPPPGMHHPRHHRPASHRHRRDATARSHRTGVEPATTAPDGVRATGCSADDTHLGAAHQPAASATSVLTVVSRRLRPTPSAQSVTGAIAPSRSPTRCWRSTR